jgi:hypothetical protein
MGLLLVEVLLVRGGREKMDMVESEVVGMADKVEEAAIMEVPPDPATLVGLGASLAVNGGEASDFQRAVDIEVVAEVLGEAIESLKSGKVPYHSQHQLVAKTVETKTFLKPLEIATMAQSRSLIQEQDYRLKQVPKEPTSSDEKPDRSHFMSKRHPIVCDGRLSTDFGGGQQLI